MVRHGSWVMVGYQEEEKEIVLWLAVLMVYGGPLRFGDAIYNLFM